ncbi:MAG TPA: hypothetical protein DHV38_12430 [Corynebacterium casei]|nr:hypothetical protein [Corynebacterium casei]
MAIIFLVISGLGAVVGTEALSSGAVGLLSKLVTELHHRLCCQELRAWASNYAYRVSKSA